MKKSFLILSICVFYSLLIAQNNNIIENESIKFYSNNPHLNASKAKDIIANNKYYGRIDLSPDSIKIFSPGEKNIYLAIKDISVIKKKRMSINMQHFITSEIFVTPLSYLFVSNMTRSEVLVYVLLIPVGVVLGTLPFLIGRGYRNYIEIETTNGNQFIVYTGTKTRKLLKKLKAKNIEIAKDYNF